MPPSRRLLSLLFTVGLHGVLTGALLLAPQQGTSAPDTVYQISLGEVPIAAGVGSCAPSAQGENPPLPAVAETQPQPEPSPPVTEPTPPVPPEPEKTVISAKKAAVPERRPNTPPKPAPRPQAIRPPTAPAEAAPASQTATSGSGDVGTNAGSESGSRNVDGLAAYSADTVDQIPAIARKVMPDYPTKARRLEMQGRVIVRLVVDTSGMPQACAVYEARPPGYFETAALDAARRTRFIPGKLRGQAVNTVVLLPFTFSLR